MTSFILAALVSNSMAFAPDPLPPLYREVPAFDLSIGTGTRRVTVCENGVCRVVEVVDSSAASPSVPVPAAKATGAGTCPDCTCATAGDCGSATCSGAASFAVQSAPAILARPVRTFFERVRTWYPGKAFQRVRGRAFGGLCN